MAETLVRIDNPDLSVGLRGSSSRVVVTTASADVRVGVVPTGGPTGRVGPQGPPGASIYVTDDWSTDPNNPDNGGSLAAGILVVQRM